MLDLVHVVPLRHGNSFAVAMLPFTITHRIVGDEDIGVYLSGCGVLLITLSHLH